MSRSRKMFSRWCSVETILELDLRTEDVAAMMLAELKAEMEIQGYQPSATAIIRTNSDLSVFIYEQEGMIDR